MCSRAWLEKRVGKYKERAAGRKDSTVVGLVSHANISGIHLGDSREAFNSFKQENGIVHL